MGDDIFNVFNKCMGGYVFGGKIVLIFFNIMEDVGVLLIEVDVFKFNMGDVIDVYLFEGKVCNYVMGEVFVIFKLKIDVLYDEVCVGGCILLIVGCGLMDKVCYVLGLEVLKEFCCFVVVVDSGKGYMLVQKMVGKVCGV